jgi:hypothetical protein
MKKLLASLAGLLIFSFSFGQKSVGFTMGLLPNSIYENTVAQKIKIELNLDSSKAELIAKMEANGMKNPTIQEQATSIETQTTCGPFDKSSGKMPVITSILSSDEKISKLFTPETRFIGTARLNELPVYDSISGIFLEADQKAQMLKLLSSMSQINLPHRNMKPGDSDTLHSPMSIPLAGVDMKMDYVTVFHLKSVKGSTAFFDLNVSFNLGMEVRDLPVDGYGSGTGTMEYDLKNQYPTSYGLGYLIKMRIAKEGLILHMIMDADLTSTCKIKPL